MPLSALECKNRLLREISLDDEDRFYDLLSQADERLLQSGNWQWTRRAIDLTPVDGIVTLPQAYESIVGCKIGTIAKGVLWQEIEFLEGGPGTIPVQGCNGQLLDLGTFDVLASPATTRIAFSGTLSSGGDPFELPEYLLANPSPLHPNGRWSHYEGLSVIWDLFWNSDGDGAWNLMGLDGTIWVGSDDSEDPTGGPWVPTPPAEGTPVLVMEDVLPVYNRERRYRCTGEDPEEIVVLARHAPRTTDEDGDYPVCQNFAALKLALQSLIYEDNNDPERSLNAMRTAIEFLNNQEQAARGTAKKVFNPRFAIPLRRSPTNFP